MEVVEIEVAKSVNDFVPRDRWIASLSNGETIFQDERQGQKPAWSRLADYVRQNKLAITQLRVQIGGLEVKLPANQEGYVQKKKAFTYMNGPSGSNLCIGYIQGDVCGVYYLGSDNSSYFKIEGDPGPPFAIYRHDIECNRKCCK